MQSQWGQKMLRYQAVIADVITIHAYSHFIKLSHKTFQNQNQKQFIAIHAVSHDRNLSCLITVQQCINFFTLKIIDNSIAQFEREIEAHLKLIKYIHTLNCKMYD